MVESVKPRNWRDIASAGLLAAAWMPLVCAAQTFTDPMRPPAEFLKQATESRGIETPPDRPVLESILFSDQRRMALINGKMVKVGDKVGPAVVTKITEEAVVLRVDGKLETIRMFPNLEKRVSASRAINAIDPEAALQKR
jgi:MSHA biogenesis protein MshK